MTGDEWDRIKHVIDKRLSQLEDPDKQYTTEEAAAELGIDLDDATDTDPHTE